MTTRRKRLMAASVVAVIAIATPAVVGAVHPFEDVPDGQWYSEPVDWAYNNGITTGTSDTTFSGTDVVTRYQNITFTHRYDQTIVQPAIAALEARLDALEAAVDDQADDISTLTLDRSRTVGETDSIAVVDWDGTSRDIDVSVAAPTDGVVILDYIVNVSVDDSETAVGTGFASAQLFLNGGNAGASATVLNFNTTEHALNERTLHVRQIVEVEQGQIEVSGEIAGFFPVGGLGLIRSQTITAIFVPELLRGTTFVPS